MTNDNDAQRRWHAYIESLGLPALDFAEVLDDIWAVLAPSCKRLSDLKKF